MKLICRYYEKWLLAFALGELKRSNPLLSNRIGLHIECCDLCKRRLNIILAANNRIATHASAIRNTTKLSRKMDDILPTSSVSGRVMAAIEPEMRFESPLRYSPALLPFLSVAAFAMIGIAMFDPISGLMHTHPSHVKKDVRQISQPSSVTGDTPTISTRDDKSSNSDPFAPGVLSHAQQYYGASDTDGYSPKSMDQTPSVHRLLPIVKNSYSDNYAQSEDSPITNDQIQQKDSFGIGRQGSGFGENLGSSASKTGNSDNEMQDQSATGGYDPSTSWESLPSYNQDKENSGGISNLVPPPPPSSIIVIQRQHNDNSQFNNSSSENR